MNILKQTHQVLFVEKRLPHRISIPLNKFLYKKPFDALLEQVSDIKPITCSINANTTFHMLTSASDTQMAILALRSFLQYFPDININIYGDSSLSIDDASRIKKTLPSAKIVLYPEFESTLDSNKDLASLFRKLQERFSLAPDFAFRATPWAMKFVIPHLYRHSKRHVLLDSDTLFISNPDEVIAWCKSDSPIPFHTRPLWPNLRANTSALAKIFPDIKIIPAFNAGFLGFDSSIFPLDYTLDTVKTAVDSDLEIFSDECLWRYLSSGVTTTELPYRNYPMLCQLKDAGSIDAVGEVKYFHFHLKHKGGVYYKYAKTVLQALADDR